MREQMLKAMKRHQLIDIIYMAKNGDITKRRVKVVGDSTQVYCYAKNVKRTLILGQILAVKPVVVKEQRIG